MRHPIWIINSILLLLVIIALGFVMVSRNPVPVWQDIEPIRGTQQPQKQIAEVNIARIYENDLFETYQVPITTKPSLLQTIPFPEPPHQRPIEIPQEARPAFLEPLKISLKGIVFVVHDDSKNRIILADNVTKYEKIYRVGDTIEDAQLIKIFNNKAVFLRANGQQEMLYLRQKDAQLDPAYAIVSGWKGVAQTIGDNTYLISIENITHYITSLADFIDQLQITFVYKEGKSIGCRIGLVDKNSLATELGLQQEDIITHVNGIKVKETAECLRAYNAITSLQPKDTITVNLVRAQVPLTITYTLAPTLQLDSEHKPGATKPTISKQQLEQEQIKELQERHKLAPTVQEIRDRERKNMLEKGKLHRNTITSKLNNEYHEKKAEESL